MFWSYSRNFGAKCSKCCRGIAASDWVRRARELVFHLACFACDQCGRQLSTGRDNSYKYKTFWDLSILKLYNTKTPTKTMKISPY